MAYHSPLTFFIKQNAEGYWVQLDPVSHSPAKLLKLERLDRQVTKTPDLMLSILLRVNKL